MLEIHENKGRLNESLKRRLEQLPVSAISDGLVNLGISFGNVLPGGLMPLVPVDKTIVGLATTIHAPEGTSLPLHLAVFTHAKDRILVVSTEDFKKSAYIGDIQALIAEKNGCLAIVIEGYIRDSRDIAKGQMPVFSYGHMPNKPNKKEIGAINKDIVIGETKIVNGDIVCADNDGVVIIPAERVEDVIVAAEEKDKKDILRRENAENFDYLKAKCINDYLPIMTKELQNYLK